MTGLWGKPTALPRKRQPKGALLLAVDLCPHSFHTLAVRILPRRMKELRRAITNASPLALFDTPGLGLRGIMRLLETAEDFSGCYVLLCRNKPVYVGISRRVLYRLYSHIRGTSHFTATLAFRMAAAETGLKLSREQHMAEMGFRRAFAKKKKQMRQWKVAWVAIENPVELCLFEVFCAMGLNTSKWNTFKTH